MKQTCGVCGSIVLIPEGKYDQKCLNCGNIVIYEFDTSVYTTFKNSSVRLCNFKDHEKQILELKDKIEALSGFKTLVESWIVEFQNINDSDAPEHIKDIARRALMEYHLGSNYKN